MAGEDPKHLAKLPVLGTAATELHWEAGTQHTMFLQRNVVLGDEPVLVVTARGTRGKFRTQPMHEGDEITRHDQSLLAYFPPARAPAAASNGLDAAAPRRATSEAPASPRNDGRQSAKRRRS